MVAPPAVRRLRRHVERRRDRSDDRHGTLGAGHHQEGPVHPEPQHPGSIYIKPADLKNPNSSHGTCWPDVVTLLKLYGVDAVISDKANLRNRRSRGIEEVEQLLGQGHAVIVGVNAERIWGDPIAVEGRPGNPVSDHAVVMTGIDTTNNVVHLIDSGDPKGRDEQIPLELFMKSWDTSGEMVIVTTGTIKK